jgi:hypothetical protein
MLLILRGVFGIDPVKTPEDRRLVDAVAEAVLDWFDVPKDGHFWNLRGFGTVRPPNLIEVDLLARRC